MDKKEIGALAEKAKSGDSKAFEKLYNEFYSKLLSFCKKQVKNKEAAEDIVSESFVTALEKIGELKTNENFGSWLYSIAYNKCRDHLNKMGSKAAFEGDTEQKLCDPVMLPDDFAENEQTRQQLRSIIDSLDNSARFAVIMYYYEEHSLREVASALGISENAAGQKLFRARKKIKKQIEKHFGSVSLLAAVPLNAVLNNTLDIGTVAAKSALVKKSAAVKIISALVAALAVAVPVGIHFARIWGGEYRPQYNGVCFGSGGAFVCPQGIVGSSGSIIQFKDFESGESMPLCSKPDCKHYDESCNAYYDVPVFEDIFENALYVLDDGEGLNTSTLYKSSTDGTSRKKIAELDIDGDLSATYVISGGKLFFFGTNTDTQTNDMSFYPMIVDLKSGEACKGEQTGSSAVTLLYTQGDHMIYSVFKTKFDVNEYYDDVDQLDKMLSDPEQIEFNVYKFDGENTVRLPAFDTYKRAFYCDGEHFIINRVEDNTYCLTDNEGGIQKELIKDPKSVSAMLYNTIGFTGSDGKYLYYDKDTQELIKTESTVSPMLLYNGRAVLYTGDDMPIDDFAKGKANKSSDEQQTVVLDDKYYAEHWRGKKILHILSDMSVCDTVCAVFNDKLVSLGKDYVVSFEQDRVSGTAGEHVALLEDMRNKGEAVDIFSTGAIAEGESCTPYSLCIEKGLCAPIDDMLKNSTLEKAYSETVWKCLQRNGRIYGTSGNVNIGAGLCFDVRVSDGFVYKSEIEKMSDLYPFLQAVSDGNTAMYLNEVLAEHIKNQNGSLVDGCIPIRLNEGKAEAFDPYSTEFFEDYLNFVFEGKKDKLIGDDIYAEIFAGNRKPKDIDTSQITIKGMEDYAAPIETEVWCISSWSENSDLAFDFLETMAQSEELNNLLYYGIEDVTYTLDGDTVTYIERDDIFAAEHTLGNELLLIENKRHEAALRKYIDSLPVLDLGVYDFSEFNEEFEVYSEIIGKYKAMLTGDDEDYEKSLQALRDELTAAGYQRTIDKINTILNGE